MKTKIEKYQNDNPKDGSLKFKKKKDKFLLAVIGKQRQKVVTEDQESR